MTVGDACCAAFTSPSSAHAAVPIAQRAVVRATREGIEPLCAFG